ncbi:MAG: hypothetical protein HYX27_20730 [Acidobacteria bacterium]|nr:hypothetical protein [Acidobacteriota bacterium]
MTTTWVAKATVLAIGLLPNLVYGGNEKNYRYLALGDSVAFGYDPTVTDPTPDRYTGYPETVAAKLNLLQSGKHVNGACPGQSSATFLAPGVDIGCDPFKAAVGLHTRYDGTQISFAISELLDSGKIDIVTLSIGGNDLSLLQASCEGPDFAACVAAGLPTVLNLYGQNLTQILSGIRFTGKYNGKLVLLKYYSPSADPLFQQTVQELNQVMTAVGAQFNARFADGFAAFYFASLASGGDACEAGLLVRLSPTTCDIHPSPKGRDLLAGAVLLALQE